MDTLEGLQASLAALEAERRRITNVGKCLQHCWLVQVKPGGTARTNRQYWQVRSCQAILDGKKLKHLKPEEVEDYKAAIARGQQLKQIDRLLKMQSQRLGQLKATQERLSISNEPSQGKKRRQTLTIPTASSPRINSDILTAHLFTPLVERRDINADEGAVKMSGFIVTQRQPESEQGAARDVLTKLEQPDVRAEQLIAKSEQLRALLQQSRDQSQQSCAQSQALATATLRLKERFTQMAKGSFLYLS